MYSLKNTLVAFVTSTLFSIPMLAYAGDPVMYNALMNLLGSTWPPLTPGAS